ncbi:MAG: hypothetical protein ABJG55_13675 [Paracoccaceae bacterium]
MRNTLAISQFFQDMSVIANVAGHPNRKQFDIMRPGGRSLDVCLVGDMSGLPVILLSTLSRHTFPSWYEEKLADGGVLAIHIWRQGQGRSDPLPKGFNLALGMADDLIAPLNHLEIKTCPLICWEGSTVDALRMSHHTEGHISKIMCFSSFLPLRLRNPKLTLTPWATAMSEAAKMSPKVLRMIIIAGQKAWQAVGSRNFARSQLHASAADLHTIDLPGVSEALSDVLLGSIAQGLDENCRTMNDVF